MVTAQTDPLAAVLGSHMGTVYVLAALLLTLLPAYGLVNVK